VHDGCQKCRVKGTRKIEWLQRNHLSHTMRNKVMTFWTALWQETKRECFTIHLKLSSNQCNSATRILQQRKNSEYQTSRKIMETVFRDRKGPLLVDFLPWGDTINAAAYCETLIRSHRAIQNKRRGMLTQGVCLQHDNARPHTARVTQELL
jgi:hypothetical protein